MGLEEKASELQSNHFGASSTTTSVRPLYFNFFRLPLGNHNKINEQFSKEFTLRLSHQ